MLLPVVEGVLEEGGVECVLEDLKCSVFAISFTSYSSGKLNDLDEDLDRAGLDGLSVFGKLFRTAIVSDDIPTSIKTGWFVRAPIRALQPAP